MLGANKPNRVVTKRALRFGRRLAGEKLPTFALLKQQADQSSAEPVDEGEIGDIMALLHCRPAIDHELNGQRLAPLVKLINEERFDLICAADVPHEGNDARARALPLASDVRDRGEALLIEAKSSPEFARLEHIAREIFHATARSEPQAEASA